MDDGKENLLETSMLFGGSVLGTDKSGKKLTQETDFVESKKSEFKVVCQSSN